MKLKRVWHDYRDWEEVAHNMWGEATDTQQALWDAIAFTSDHVRYGSYMMRVIQEWPISCENALTDNTLNQKAWLGHAATALALSIPEDITRKAWGHLTDEQRLLANKEAERAISTWKDVYAKSKNLHSDMGGSLL